MKAAWASGIRNRCLRSTGRNRTQSSSVRMKWYSPTPRLCKRYGCPVVSIHQCWTINTVLQETRQSFYGFLNLKTGQQHTFTTDKQNMLVTAEILAKVRKLYPTQKLVIFGDTAGWNTGSKAPEWITNDGNTETVCFPPYTPDFNPQEHVWKAGRTHVTHNRHPLPS